MKNLSYKISWLFIIICIILLIPMISKSMETFRGARTANRIQNSLALGYLGVAPPQSYNPAPYL